MKVIYLLLFLIAVVCFALAAFTAPRIPPRINLVALGLLAWVLVPTIVHIDSMG